MLSSLHKQLLNDFQREFPLTSRPYQAIADSLGVTEEEVLFALQELNERELISRIGPVIRPNQIGKSMLVAMAVPENRLQQVADLVNRYPEVNHNYERDNRFNLWFVVIANDDRHLQSVVKQIERESGVKTMQLPLLADYFIDLGFEMNLNDGCN